MRRRIGVATDGLVLIAVLMGACTNGDNHQDGHHHRSGAFIAGNFASFIAGWDGTLETSKLYYIPAAPVAGQPLTVVAELLNDAAPQTVAFPFGATAWTISGIPSYATGTVLPARGREHLTPTTGRNSGELRVDA